MKQILMIEVSPRGKDSASRSVADTLATRLSDFYLSAQFMCRDLPVEPPPIWTRSHSGPSRPFGDHDHIAEKRLRGSDYDTRGTT